MSSLPFGALAKARIALLNDGRTRTQVRESDDRSRNVSGSVSDSASDDMEENRTVDETRGSNSQVPKPKREIEKRAHKHAYVSSPIVLFSFRFLTSEIQADGNIIQTRRDPTARSCTGAEISEYILARLLSVSSAEHPSIPRGRCGAQDRRDPRFSALSGTLDPETFAKSYSFLSDIQKIEVPTLKGSLNATRKALLSSPREMRPELETEISRLERALKRAESSVQKSDRDKRERKALMEAEKAEREKRAQGKGSWYMKKCESFPWQDNTSIDGVYIPKTAPTSQASALPDPPQQHLIPIPYVMLKPLLMHVSAVS